MRNHDIGNLDSSRRDFLRNAGFVASAAVAGVPLSAHPESVGQTEESHLAKRPNVLMICADQFRADFVGANHMNPSVQTPHINALAMRGVNFTQCITNQPLCSPSRASFLTSRYATETGVWGLGPEPDHDLPTIASEFRKNGYSASFVGKWHLSKASPETDRKSLGWVSPGPSRGGFDDLWEGANVLELVSHPYEGNYWDSAGTNIGFKGEYRVDFLTRRAVQVIEQEHQKPWFLFLSQLEPHHQNDIDQFVPPKRYEDKYIDPYVPMDLRNLPGNWRSHLPGYYGCVQAIDDCIGTLVDALKRTNQLENTIILFFSDHGCTFRTRMGEYKRSPHESSLRVPFIVAGPGFNQSRVVTELVSLLDLTPTLLDGAGITPPAEMRGKTLKALAESPEVRQRWDSAVYFQISQSICGRGLRTKDWCYCAFDPYVPEGNAAYGTHYQDFALYSIAGDPVESVNLVGRPEYQGVLKEMRAELQRRMIAAGEPKTEIAPIHYYA